MVVARAAQQYFQIFGDQRCRVLAVAPRPLPQQVFALALGEQWIAQQLAQLHPGDQGKWQGFVLQGGVQHPLPEAPNLYFPTGFQALQLVLPLLPELHRIGGLGKGQTQLRHGLQVGQGVASGTLHLRWQFGYGELFQSFQALQQQAPGVGGCRWRQRFRFLEDWGSVGAFCG